MDVLCFPCFLADGGGAGPDGRGFSIKPYFWKPETAHIEKVQRRTFAVLGELAEESHSSHSTSTLRWMGAATLV